MSKQLFLRATKMLGFTGLLIALFIWNPNIANAETTAMDIDGVTVTELETHKVTTGADDDIKLDYYAITSDDGTSSIAINIPVKGIFSFELCNTSNDSVGIRLYKDESCSGVALASCDIGSDSYYDSEAGLYYNYSDVYISKAGTYYLQLDKASALFGSLLFSSEDRNIKDKTWTAAAGDYNNSDVYFKIKPTKNGYIIVDSQFFGNGSANVTLCNSKKKAISKDNYTSNNYTTDQNKAAFALKKDTTYYVKVSSSNPYRIRSTFKAVTDTSGATKAKAKTMTFGKAVSGLIMAEDKTSKADYYKFTLSSASKPTLVFKGNSVGTIYIDIIGDSIYGGSGYAKINKAGDGASSKLQLSDGRSLPKGTYYIKVYKDDTKVSGNYSLTIKK